MEISFEKAIIIKTKDTKVIKTLNTNDLQWRRKENPRYRYETLSCPDQEDEFYRGILYDKQEKDAFHGLYKLAIVEIKRNKPIIGEPITFLYRLKKIANDLRNHIGQQAEKIEVSSVDELEKIPMLKGTKLVKII